VFLYYLALRLGLEKTAAHEELVWAAGGTFALFVILPFFGWYCGRRGQGFGKFVRQLLAVAFAQRLPLVAFAYFATTRHLGTHLDTHVVTDIAPPGFGEQKLVSDFDRWLWPTAIPHLSLWIVLTLVAGLVLAVPAWLVAKRVRPAPAAH
jgi:hypothetical protein